MLDTSRFLAWLDAYAELLAERRAYLTDLDRPIGDADHGANMARGFAAVMAQRDALAEKPLPDLLKTVAMTLISKVGGASGPLYGTFFLQAASALDGAAASPQQLAAAVEAGLEGVRRRGRAEPGDKTMVDAMAPAAQALRQALDEGADLGEALARAARAAREGFLATEPLLARKGRASYLGERSRGHLDPGAASTYYLFRTAAAALPDTPADLPPLD